MNAQLKPIPVLRPIEARVIHRPNYANAYIHHFQKWYTANEPKLVEYFNELGSLTPECQREEDFFLFAACQYDMELARENPGKTWP